MTTRKPRGPKHDSQEHQEGLIMTTRKPTGPNHDSQNLLRSPMQEGGEP